MRKLVVSIIVFCVLLILTLWTYAKDLLKGDYVNVASMVAALAILILTVGVSMKYINQIKNDTADGELKDDEWDGIKEYKNNIPTGWGISFILAIVWAFWYMQPFVDLKNYGTNSFSQIGQWNEETLAHKAKYEKQWINADKETLSNMGESLFLVQCSQCHGIDARGINGKARDLTSWGNEEYIKNVIVNGSNGINGYYGMPAGLLSKQEDINAVASYVADNISLSKKSVNSQSNDIGKTLYSESCASCHGENGKGIQGVGIDLTYLADAALKNGKKGSIGTMPSFNSVLSDIQFKALNEYIYSLNN
jgi:cytochrome c oxidase cbb3-type subunit 3